MAISVRYEDLQNASSRLRAGEQDIVAKLHELQNYINSLVGDGFVTDHASVQFHDTYTNFTNGITQGIDALNGLAQFLDQTATTLEQTDQQLGQSLSNG